MLKFTCAKFIQLLSVIRVIGALVRFHSNLSDCTLEVNEYYLDGWLDCQNINIKMLGTTIDDLLEVNNFALNRVITE